MSAALYIVLDREEPGFDPFVNGKFLAKDGKNVDKIARKLGLKAFDDYVYISDDELGDLLGEEAEGPGTEAKWHMPDEGLQLVARLIDYVKSSPKDVKNAAGVLSDLEEYKVVFEKARAIGAKWHLGIDI